MSEVHVFPRDPGREVRTSRGSVVNLLLLAQRTAAAGVGVEIMGAIGTPTNDRGAPNVPVRLSGVQDLFARWGGFSPYVGDGAAEGYNGNIAALLWSLVAARIVFQPVDMALKDKSVAEADAADLLVSLARGARTFTVESDDETFTTADHGLAVGDSLQLVRLTGGDGATVATTYFVKTATTDTFTLSSEAGGSTLLIGADGSGTWRPVAVAAGIDLAARTLPAGTRIKASGGFTVRTLEDVVWARGEFGAKSVRVAKVTGSVVTIDTVNALVGVEGRDAYANGSYADSTLIVCTTDDTLPDDTDAPETLLRYQRAMAALNTNEVGSSATVLIADRTEAAISDALASHCAAATSEGIFRVAVVAPPVGTSVEDAVADSGDGVGRTTLDGDYAICVHPAIKRRFPLDADNLSAAQDYKATFPAHALFAAKMLNVRPEENPAYVEAEPGVSYGVAELEAALTREQKEAHFGAGICTTVFERLASRRVCAWRDGVMVSGAKIARKRLTNFLAANLIERLTPWHKRLATPANQQGAMDACDTWLQSLAPERIFGHELAASWDGETEELRIDLDVVELGNMDVLTLGLAVSARGFTVLTGNEEGA